MVVKSFIKKFCNESGSVTLVEAVYIFPIVFFVLGFLIVTSFYQLQKTSLQSDAQRIALLISKSKVNTDFNQFGSFISNKIDLGEIPQTYPLRQTPSNYNPYRYLTSKIENIEMLNKQVKSLIQKNAYLCGSKIGSEVKCINNFPNQKVIVSFRSQIEYPGFLVYLGLPKINFIHVTGIAEVLDSTEYVRNVDLASDAITFINDKTKLGEDFKKYISDIGKVIPNLK